MRLEDLNPEELGAGMLHGLAFAFILGPWCIVTGLGCAFLWAFGGAKGTKKAWRRVGVSLVIGIALALIGKSWLPLLSIGPAIGILGLGYGIPSYHPDGTVEDEGSTIGKFVFHNITGGKDGTARS